MVALTAAVAWDIVQQDVLAHNPHRSLGPTLASIPLMGAGIGIILVVQRFSGAMLLGALLACAWMRRFGRSAPWPLLLLLPCGALLAYGQGQLLQISWYTDHPDDAVGAYGTGRQILFNLVFLAPAYLGAWWWLRPARPAAEAGSQLP